jgi:hypothetical protein
MTASRSSSRAFVIPIFWKTTSPDGDVIASRSGGSRPAG